jgi:hypothetical protein
MDVLNLKITDTVPGYQPLQCRDRCQVGAYPGVTESEVGPANCHLYGARQPRTYFVSMNITWTIIALSDVPIKSS